MHTTAAQQQTSWHFATAAKRFCQPKQLQPVSAQARPVPTRDPCSAVCEPVVTFSLWVQVSATLLGEPDLGLLTPPEMARKAGQIVYSIPGVPVLVDADTGVCVSVLCVEGWRVNIWNCSQAQLIQGTGESTGKYGNPPVCVLDTVGLPRGLHQTARS